MSRQLLSHCLFSNRHALLQPHQTPQQCQRLPLHNSPEPQRPRSALVYLPTPSSNCKPTIPLITTTMATFYSSFFSSGLLAVDSEGVHRPRTPDPTTPRAFAKSFTDDATPTASTFSSPVLTSSGDALPSLLAQTEAITIASDRPRMRRRRSSLSLSSSPVAPLKGTPPLPRAAVHLQRQSMPVAGRTRSGSVTESISFTRSAMSMASGDATKSNSLMGRLRSGSVGNALR